MMAVLLLCVLPMKLPCLPGEVHATPQGQWCRCADTGNAWTCQDVPFPEAPEG